ncbi:diguanylate cyclase (GGDEF)-like protein [Marinicella litoralis]|uniref:diguanylate cyclase n=2 Tax=Marinicella litoralis TaxID=644220 RepID=A0A4V3DHJ3_9GAMM|nr:diguanylate cyclase (GGDEF)-like protein [Marinicella litoralis]
MLTRHVFLLLAWLAVWQMGRLVEYTDHASVWFPVAGLTFSALLVLGKRAILAIMTGAIVITVWQANHYQLPLSLLEMIWAGFLFGLAHILPYWLGASLIGRLSQHASHSAPQLIVTFLVVAAVTAFIVTVLVISSLVVTNQLDVSDVGKTLLPFWIGDMAGVIVLTPLFTGILIYLFPNAHISLDEFTREGLGSLKRLAKKMGLNIALIIATMLLAYLSGTPESSFAIFFLAVTHMWIACTESPVFNVVSLAASSLLIVLLVHLLGLMDHVMVYQFAINVIAANALFGIAVPQLKAYNQELEHLVYTDTLTHVSSRQYMVQQAEVEIARCHQHKVPLTLVVFDLDDFKLINDQHGHIAGDKALQSVCEVAKSMLSKTDVIARFGGDEFVLMFPGLRFSAAFNLVEQIRMAIHQILIDETTVSASFGIAELQAKEDFISIFHRADQALYRAKQKGGNQIGV